MRHKKTSLQSSVAEFHVVLSLSHDLMLGFDWLHICNPHINWWAYTLLIKTPGRHCLLAGLPCNSIEHVEPASFDSIYKEVDYSVVAWFTLVHPVEPPNAMGAFGTLSGGESGDT